MAMRNRCSPPWAVLLLQQLGAGRLPITYRLGAGPAQVHLKVTSNWDIKPIYDVIAKIPGSTEPDEWIIRGNHHDAWVNGADDPISGQVDELEEARALAELVKQGWRPKRTIYLLRVGWRRAGPARFHGVGRNARRRASNSMPSFT